jgi:tetratricopeptide (TPR) repeat protein
MTAKPARLWKQLASEGRLRLGELAVARGLVASAKVDEALLEQPKLGKPLGRILLDKGWITPEALGTLLVEQEALCGADPRVPRAGRFLLLRELGRGGMGVVWEAWDPQLSRRVAVKMVRQLDDVDARGRILKEARAAAAIQHPGIVPVHEVLEHDGCPCIAMTLVDGRALDPADRLDPRRAAEIVRDAARAVQAAHEKGVVHRDLKPGNLMTDAAGRVFVLDFGVAAVELDAVRTASGVVCGTPAYMSPEQAMGRRDLIGPATDVYGLGATLYALLAKHPPFHDRRDMDILRAVPFDEPAALRKVSGDLARIVQKAMDKVPAARYASAAEFADDLDRFLRGEPILGRPTSATWRFVRRHPRAIASSALATIGFMIVVAFIVKATRAEETLDRRAKANLLFEPGRRFVEDARLLLYQKGTTSADVEKLVARARPLLEQASAADPTFAEPEHALGRCDALLGRRADAEAHLAEALRRNPAHLEPLLDRGLLALTLALEQYDVLGAAAPPALAKRAEEDLTRYAAVELTGLTKAALAHVRGQADAAALCEALVKDPRVGDEALFLLGRIRWGAHDGAGALEALEEAVGRRPHHRHGRMLLAMVRRARGEFEKALEELERGLAIDPAFAPFLVVRAALQAQLGRLAECERSLDHAERNAKDAHTKAAVMHLRGVLHTMRGARSDAMRDFRAALELDPDRVDSMLAMVREHLGLGELEAAESLAARIEERSPAEGAIARGWVHRERGDRPAALRAFTRALELKPQSYDARLQRAHCLEGAAALEEFERLASREPGRWEAHAELAKIRRSSAPESALRSIESAIRAAPTMALLRASRADLLLLLVRPAEAVEEARAAIAMDETLDLAHRYLAKALLARKDPEGAMKAAEEAVHLRASPGNYLVRAQVHGMVQRWREAVSDLEEAVRKDGRFLDGWEHLGFAYGQVGRFDDAVRANETAIGIDSERGLCRQNFGLLLMHLKRYDEAIVQLEAARRLMPDTAVVLEPLGYAYFQKGRRREAVDAWEDAVRAEPRLEEALRPWIREARKE